MSRLRRGRGAGNRQKEIAREREKCAGVPRVQWLEGCLIVANMRS